METVVARWVASRWQVESNRYVVWKCVAWVELVGDGVGITVVASVVALEAGGLIHGLIGKEAGVRLRDKRVLGLVVGAAMGARNELGGQGGHQRLTDRERGVAGQVERLLEQDGRAGGTEEGFAVLKEEGYWDAGSEGAVTEE